MLIKSTSIFRVFNPILLLDLFLVQSILLDDIHCADEKSNSHESMNATHPIVNIKLGKIKGKYIKVRVNVTKDDEEDKTTRIVAAYIGIPYAQPPIGDLRFAAPIATNEQWSGEYDATQPKTSCMSM